MPTPWSSGDEVQATVSLEKLVTKIDNVVAIVHLMRDRKVTAPQEAIDILCFALASLLHSQAKHGRLPEMYEMVRKVLHTYVLGDASHVVREHTVMPDEDE